LHPLVPLIQTSGPFLKSAVEGILRDAGIIYTIRDHFGPVPIIPQHAAIVGQTFEVPPDRLQEAKDLLCANGILCEVSNRLLQRALESIVKPLLEKSGDRDLSRLSHFVEVNNRETAQALLKAVLDLPGGNELLDELFFALVEEEDRTGLHRLARVLGPRSHQTFHERLRRDMEGFSPQRQTAILDVIQEFPDNSFRLEIINAGLHSLEPEVQEAAEEAAYSLGWKLKKREEGGD
jgi:hypothetical protein